MSPKQLLSNWYDFHINSALEFKKQQHNVIESVIEKLDSVDSLELKSELESLQRKINADMNNEFEEAGSGLFQQFGSVFDKAVDFTLNRWLAILIGIFGFIIGLMSLLVTLSSFTYLTQKTNWTLNIHDWWTILSFSNQLAGMVNTDEIKLHSIYEFIFYNVGTNYMDPIVNRDNRFCIMAMDSVIKQGLWDNHGLKGKLLAITSQSSVFLKILFKNPFEENNLREDKHDKKDEQSGLDNEPL